MYILIAIVLIVLFLFVGIFSLSLLLSFPPKDFLLAFLVKFILFTFYCL